MEFSKRRWLDLTLTVPISISVGYFYAWSVFALPLSKELSLSLTTVTVAFTLSSGISGIMNIFGGIIYDKYGARLAFTLGGILFSFGIFIAGFSQSAIWLYLSYGILLGMGLGVVYCTFLMNTAKSFPDRPGFATGLVIAAYGSGSFIFAPLGNYLTECFGVLNAFKIFGIVFFIIIVLLAQFISRVPVSFNIPSAKFNKKEKSSEENVIESEVYSVKGYHWKEVLKTPLYYVLLGMVTIATSAGLMIMSHGSAIAQTIAGVNPATAAWIIGIVSIFNAIGRFLWASISDILGRSETLALIFVFFALVTFSLNFVREGQVGLLTILMILTGFSYGGAMSVFPSLTTDSFGTANSGTIFGFVFLGVTVGSFIGPTLASFAISFEGSYRGAFVIAGGLCILGAFLSLLSKKISKPRMRGQDG